MCYVIWGIVSWLEIIQILYWRQILSAYKMCSFMGYKEAPGVGGKTPPGASYPFTKGVFYPKYVGIFTDAVNFFINKSLKILDQIQKI